MASAAGKAAKKMKWVPIKWEETLENIKEMRKDRNAPVDEMGAEKCLDTEVPREVQRFHVLVSLLLSSQTKDAITFAAMQRLKDHGLTVSNIIKTDKSVLKNLITPVGFANTKAGYLKNVAQILQDKYESDIPTSLSELCDLPGIGPKMAHLCMLIAWDKVSGIETFVTSLRTSKISTIDTDDRHDSTEPMFTKVTAINKEIFEQDGSLNFQFMNVSEKETGRVTDDDQICQNDRTSRNDPKSQDTQHDKSETATTSQVRIQSELGIANASQPLMHTFKTLNASRKRKRRMDPAELLDKSVTFMEKLPGKPVEAAKWPDAEELFGKLVAAELRAIPDENIRREKKRMIQCVLYEPYQPQRDYYATTPYHTFGDTSY